MIRNAMSPRMAIKSFFISPLKLLFFLMMPRKLLLSFTLFLLLPFAGPGQTGPTEAQTRDAAVQARKTELQALMNRRTDLIRQWRRFNLEENAIFGGKSRKDLRNIAEVQQKIIQLDNTILNFGKLENYQQEKTEKKENIQLQKSLYGRIDSIETISSRHEEQISAAGKRENALKARIGRQQSVNRGLSIALVLATGLLL